MSKRCLAVWRGWTGSKHVIRSVTKMPGGTDMQRSTEIPTSRFPSREKNHFPHYASTVDGKMGMSPHGNTLHTHQVLTSRLTLYWCESNSCGSQCLIRMHTESLYSIPGCWSSQVLLFMAYQSDGHQSIAAGMWKAWKLAGTYNRTIRFF